MYSRFNQRKKASPARTRTNIALSPMTTDMGMQLIMMHVSTLDVYDISTVEGTIVLNHAEARKMAARLLELAGPEPVVEPKDSLQDVIDAALVADTLVDVKGESK